MLFNYGIIESTNHFFGIPFSIWDVIWSNPGASLSFNIEISFAVNDLEVSGSFVVNLY